MMFLFTMLFNSLLLTIMMPLALGAPASQGSTPPTLSLVNTLSDAVNVTQSHSESGVDRANKAALHLQGNRGTPSFDAHSALGTGVSIGAAHRGWKLGLNRANKLNKSYKGVPVASGTSWHAAHGTGLSSSDALGGSSGGTVGGASGGNPVEVKGTTTTSSHSTT